VTAVLTPKDFATATPSWWCPGCGDYGVLSALKSALAELGKNPKDVAFVSGIGCSGKISGYLHSYAFHGVHGRALPVATAVKLANNELTVIAAGGDGDGYAIGAGHFIHAVRRNPDVTYIVMDNQTYGLTKGQSSPTSQTGYVTGTSPNGHPEAPMNGLVVALAAGATFLARGFSAQPKILVDLLKQAITHKGFSVVEVESPCVTYNKINTYAWFKENTFYVDETYDPTDKVSAFKMLINEGKMPLGIFYREDRATFDELANKDTTPVAKQPLNGDMSRFASIQDQYR
jgi:2-oxoglutarate/2-oxoacid ferredoxin oxidoreductase subunit beta